MSPRTEHEDLNLHVSICHQRYLELNRRLNTVEEDLKEIRSTVMEIRDQLAAMPAQNMSRWDQAKSGIIGVLLTITGFLIIELLFR